MRGLANIIRIDKLRLADHELDRISSKISFNAINPVNSEAEYEKFSKTGKNPFFKYEKYREDLRELKKEVNNVKTDNSTIGKILSEIKKNYRYNIDLLEFRGNAEEFTNISKKLYGSPSRKLVKDAKKLLDLEIKPAKKIYTSKEVKTKFQLAFIKYGFPWTVEEKDMVANAAVKPSKRVLLIKKGAKFSKDFVKRLIVHEIGTHAMRAENGSMQPFIFFKRGFPGYLMTEEGLAVINEEINNCLDNRVLKIYAGRVIAIDLALRKSFSETYEVLRKHFSKSTAWRLTLRAKRGLSDTSLPGACTKDINYLKGYFAIKEFLKKGGNINKLYYGKIGLEHVELLDKMHGLINPMFLPMFRHTNFLIQHFSKILKSIIFFDLAPSISFFNGKH